MNLETGPMKAWQIALLAGLLMLFLTTAGLAEEQPAMQRAPQRPGVFAALDTNGDGVLSKDEIAAASTVLAGLDSNGDGSVALPELLPERDRDGLQRAWRRGLTAGRGFGAGWRSFAGRRGPWMRGGGSWASRSRGWAGRPWLRGFSARGRAGRGPAPPGAVGDVRARLRGVFGDRLFERFDTDGEGYLSPDNLPEGAWERLSSADTDGDGRVSREEFDAHLESAAPQRGRFGPWRRGRGGSDQEAQQSSDR